MSASVGRARTATAGGWGTGAPPQVWGRSLGRWFWLGPVLLSMLVPFIWMVAISAAPGAGGSFLRALVSPWDLDHYRTLFAGAGVTRYLVSSVLVATAVVSLNVATAALVGYVLGRRHVPGERWWTLGIVASLMLPKQVLMIPLYLVLVRMHLLDTYAALVLPFAVDAFSIFLVRQFVVALVVVAIQSFLANLNSFLFPLIFVDLDRLRTLPVGLALISQQTEHSVDWGFLMAGSTVASLPVLVVFLAFQRRILSGLLAGAEK